MDMEGRDVNISDETLFVPIVAGDPGCVELSLHNGTECLVRNAGLGMQLTSQN